MWNQVRNSVWTATWDQVWDSMWNQVRNSVWTAMRDQVWDSITKKSHLILQAKRATFTFWVDKSSLKMAIMIHFDEFLRIWRFRLNSVTRQLNFITTKVGWKCQNWKTQMRLFGDFQTLWLRQSIHENSNFRFLVSKALKAFSPARKSITTWMNK